MTSVSRSISRPSFAVGRVPEMRRCGSSSSPPNAVIEQSPEGRLDHRDRQSAYRRWHCTLHELSQPEWCLIGHFYFAQIGHYHFAATSVSKSLTRVVLVDIIYRSFERAVRFALGLKEPNGKRISIKHIATVALMLNLGAVEAFGNLFRRVNYMNIKSLVLGLAVAASLGSTAKASNLVLNGSLETTNTSDVTIINTYIAGTIPDWVVLGETRVPHLMLFISTALLAAHYPNICQPCIIRAQFHWDLLAAIRVRTRTAPVTL